VVLREGYKRQIREMAKVTGLFIVRLLRVRIGTLRLGTLKSGESRSLTADEVKRLKELVVAPKPRLQRRKEGS